MEEEKNVNTKDSKLKTTFAVFVVFVLMASIAVIFLGIDVPQEQTSLSQNSELESKEDKEREEIQESILIIDTDIDAVESKIKDKKETGFLYLSDMSCEQLADHASSMKKGLGIRNSPIQE